MLGAERETEEEPASPSFPPGHPDLPTMQVHHLLRQGQPNAGTAMATGISPVHLIQPIEYSGLRRYRHPRSGVVDSHLRPFLPLLNPHPHLPVLRRELEGVVDQIAQHFFQEIGVEPDQECCVLGRAHQTDADGCASLPPGRHIVPGISG